MAAFRAEASLEENTTLAGCGAAALGERGTATGAEGSLCSCDGEWATCSWTDAEMVPSLYGFEPCDPEQQVCFRTCVESFTGVAGSSRLPGFSLHSFHPGGAISRADDEGCIESTVPVGSPRPGISQLLGYTAAVSTVNARRPGRVTLGRAVLVAEGGLNGQPIFFQESSRDNELPDLREAAYVSLQVCEPPAAPVEADQEVCFGHGVEDVRYELLRRDGTPVNEPWARPIFFNNDGAAPAADRTTLSKQGTGYFWNVPAGEYLVRIHPPPGQRLSCTMDPLGTGVSWGLEDEAELTYGVDALSGVMNFAGRTFCMVE